MSLEDLQQRIALCESLLKRRRQFPFLDRFVTCDDKWIFYHDIKRRRQWISGGNGAVQQPRGGIYSKDMLLNEGWDIQGSVHYELLGNNQKITSNIYCNPLRRLKTT